jgi:hypothetical protein
MTAAPINSSSAEPHKLLLASAHIEPSLPEPTNPVWEDGYGHCLQARMASNYASSAAIAQTRILRMALDQFILNKNDGSVSLKMTETLEEHSFRTSKKTSKHGKPRAIL